MSSFEEENEKKRKICARKSSVDEACRPQHAVKRQREDPPWPMHLHRSFVEAVYKVGLQSSSPSIIIENMTLKSYDVVGSSVKKGTDITGEHVKSHLQKHRKKNDKAMSEFMSSYDSTLEKLQASSILDLINDQRPTSDLLEHAAATLGCPTGSLLAGEPAAFLTLCVNPQVQSNHSDENELTQSCERQLSNSPATITIEDFQANPLELLERCSSLSIPLLSQEEKNSSLGRTFNMVIGMFDLLKQNILENRRRTLNRTNVQQNVPQYADIATRASMKPIDIDDISKSCFVYESNPSSQIHLPQPAIESWNAVDESKASSDTGTNQLQPNYNHQPLDDLVSSFMYDTTRDSIFLHIATELEQHL